VLWVVDSRDSPNFGAAATANEAESTGKAESRPPAWLIRNKIDLIEGQTQRSEPGLLDIATSEAVCDPTKLLKNMVKNELTHKTESEPAKTELVFKLSAVTGEGFDRLLAQLARHAEGFLAGAEQAVVTRERHRRALEEVLATLRRARGGELGGEDLLAQELLAEELRIAARALGRLTGRVDVEDILDVIFRDFCIGK
jgi:tRNA modification GTPase